ncbi:MAG: cupredoxin domain-containing protein [Solirubrobacterales bacterium]
MTKFRMILIGSIVAAAFAVGCGSDEETASTEASSTSSSSDEETSATTEASGGKAESEVTVDIVDFKYDPPTVTVAAGGDVRWVNDDDAAHTATDNEDPGFDTGTLEQGAEKTVTFDDAGSFAYICEFHPFMKGTVEVTE